MQTKKRSDDACVKRCTLKTGWCGWGSLFRGKHAENGGERCAENGQLKGDRNESRPAIERAAADVLGIGDCRDPVLEEKTANTPARPPSRQIKGTMLRFRPSASERPSTGNGE